MFDRMRREIQSPSLPTPREQEPCNKTRRRSSMAGKVNSKKPLIDDTIEKRSRQ